MSLGTLLLIILNLRACLESAPLFNNISNLK
jgi:hypothetical protein